MGSTARWLVCLPYTEGQGSDTSEVISRREPVSVLPASYGLVHDGL